MKLQDFFPYHSTIVGLNGIFQPVGDNSYFVNSICIESEDQFIITGRTYLLYENTLQDGLKICPVILDDVFYKSGNVILIVTDLLTPRQLLISHYIDNRDTPSTWKLVDLDFLNNKIETIVINSFCDKKKNK